MELTEVLNDVEEALTDAHSTKLLHLCEEYFPEEDFGTDLKCGIIDDMYNLIIDEVRNNNESAIDIYYFLLNEKISIDENEFYTDEEINHG